MQRREVEILVTVKAYPTLSRVHGEAVCVAGVRTDTRDWARLYPVPFRDLEVWQKFKKYQLIRIAVSQSHDGRPESLSPDIHSIKVGEALDTRPSASWKKRWPYIEPLISESMCQIQKRQAVDGTSLGAFRPAEILDFEWEPADPWDETKQAIASQTSLFFPNRGSLEQVPYVFRYRYRCNDSDCRGHRQSIIDWELAEAFRNWRNQYGGQEVLKQLREKWLGMMAASDRDTVLFVGNQVKHPGNFLVLGVFWPKIRDAQR